MRGAKMQKRITDRFVLDQAFDHLGFSDERKQMVAKDFAVSHLQYAHLFAKIIRRSSGFFAVVVLFQLFALMPRHTRLDPGVVVGLDGPSSVTLPFRAAWVFVEFNHTELLDHLAPSNCSIGQGWQNSAFAFQTFDTPAP